MKSKCRNDENERNVYLLRKTYCYVSLFCDQDFRMILDTFQGRVSRKVGNGASSGIEHTFVTYTFRKQRTQSSGQSIWW